MRTISGCLKSTPTQWLPIMSAIQPPHIRREEANQRMIKKIKTMPDTIPLKHITDKAPVTTRLKSRKPSYNSQQEDFNATEAWNREWAEKTPIGGTLIEDVAQPLPGFGTYERRLWVASNRLLSRHDRTASNMYKWHLKDSPTCPYCKAAVLNCPVTRLEGGYETILSNKVTFTSWLDRHKLEV